MNKIEKILELKRSLDEGVINNDEFTILKNEILSNKNSSENNTKQSKQTIAVVEKSKDTAQNPNRIMYIVFGILLFLSFGGIFWYVITNNAPANNSILVVQKQSKLVDNNTICKVPIYVPRNGLIGWWSFNGNPNDESGNGNNGIVNGATLTADRFGNANLAYSFNGVNNYIQCNSSISNIDNITISGWAKCNSPMGGEFVQIGEDDNTSCNGIGVGKGGRSNEVGLNFWNIYNGNYLMSLLSCVNYYDSGYLLNEDSWFHFLIIKTNNKISYYVNGMLVGSNSFSSAKNPTNKIFFGTSGLLPSAKTFYKGNLDDIGIWSRALTQTEIASLYRNSVSVVALETKFHAKNKYSLYFSKSYSKFNSK